MTDTQKKIKLLTVIKKLFDKNNIEFFPIYVTLLGFIRVKHIIPWDVDIDLRMWYHDYHKAFKFMDYKLGDFPVAKYVGKNGLHFGIHQYLTDNDLRYMSKVLDDYF